MVRPTEFKIAHRATEAGVTLKVVGELDLGTVPVLTESVERVKHGIKALTLDLSDLTFMDSTGLRVILSARERWRSNGQELALTESSSQVQRLLAVSGVGERLRVVSTPDELPA